MASFTKVSGNFKPVVNVDVGQNSTQATLNEVTSAATVNLVGPKLDFATITFTGSSTTGAQIKAAIETIQQLATVYIYEFTTDTNDKLAVAFYPTGAWGDVTATASGSLDALLTTACGEAVGITAFATFTG
jgi:hypothetical protein